MNKILAIAIPTYNRSEILYDNMPSLLLEAKKYSIPIYISDNSMNDQTKNTIDHYLLDYENIFYEKNLDDVGHDRNSLSVLRIPQTDYVWLLGDSLKVSEFAIRDVLDVINKYTPGLVAVNAVGRELNFNSGNYQSCVDVFSMLGWHLTLTGAVIYSREAIESMDYEKILKNNNFPQIPLIFNYLATHKSLYWINNKIIKASKKKKGYWASKALSIFIDDWSNSINNLSSIYPKNVKNKVILKHSHKTNVFGFKSLIMLRVAGGFNYRLLRSYGKTLMVHSTLKPMLVVIISVVPIILLKFLFLIRKILRQ